MFLRTRFLSKRPLESVSSVATVLRWYSPVALNTTVLLVLPLLVEGLKVEVLGAVGVGLADVRVEED